MKKNRHTSRRNRALHDDRDRPNLQHHLTAGAVSGAVRAIVTWLIAVATGHSDGQ
jgi:O-glycosyl hydrolase